MIPDTIHPDTGKAYRWVANNSLEDIIRPSDLPLLTPQHIEQLAELLAPLMPNRPEGETERVEVRAVDLTALERRRHEANARVAFEKEISKLKNTARPGRNATLFRITRWALGAYVHHGIIKQSELEKELLAACESNGLIDDNGLHDVMNTINVGIRLSKGDSLPPLKERPY